MDLQSIGERVYRFFTLDQIRLKNPLEITIGV